MYLLRGGHISYPTTPFPEGTFQCTVLVQIFFLSTTKVVILPKINK
jgi:hypothetical protein